MNSTTLSPHRTSRLLPNLRRRRFDPSALLPLVIALLIAYLTLVPVASMVIDSFHNQAGDFSLRHYTVILSSGTAYHLMGTSAQYAIGAALIGTIIGTILAWLVERTNIPGRRVIFAAALVPLIMPGSLATFSWVLLLSPNIGIINTALRHFVGGTTGPFTIYSMPGMIMVEGIHLSTLAFLMVVGALKSMDASLEEAASSSGASVLATARRITLPLLLPAIGASLLIGFVRAVEGFEVPAMLGLQAGKHVLASQIYLSLKNFPPDYGAAGSYSVLLFLIGAIGVIIYLRLIARGGYATVTGKAFRPRQIDLHRWKYPALLITILYTLILFLLPALVMIWASLLPYYSAPSKAALHRVSLDNYTDLFHNGLFLDSARNSLVMAFVAASIVMLLTAVSAWITNRTKIPGRQALDLMAFIPIAIPGIVLGVAMIKLYAASPIPIYGTILVLIITLVIKFLPYGMRQSSATIIQISPELEEAAAVSGANWWHSFTRVLLPLLRPGLFSAWVYIFIVSIREMSAMIMLSSPKNTPLAVLIYELYTNGDYNELSALGVIMVAGLTLLVLLFRKLGGNPSGGH